MIHFLRNYPFRFYLQHAFRAPHLPAVDVHLKVNGHINMLVDKERDLRLYVEDSIDLDDTAMEAKLAEVAGVGPYRLSYLLDSPDIELRLITIDALGLESLAQLQATPIRSLLPAFEQGEEFIWEFLGTDLLPLQELLPETVLLVGIPLNLREKAEHFTETTEGVITRIVPHLLAILRYAQEETSNFLLIPGDTQSMLALFSHGELKVLEKYPGVQSLTQHPERLSERIQEFAASLNIENPILTLYPGEIAPLRARELANKLPLEKAFIEAPKKPDDTLESAEGHLPLEAFVLRHSRCYPSSSFVPQEHRERSLYFTNRHYRGTFYILGAFTALQLIAVGIFSHQWLSLGGLHAEATHLKTQAGEVEQQATLLAPLIQRIQASAKWTTIARERQPVSLLLSRIESSIPKEVCLRSISLTDTGHSSEQIGSKELTITGWRQEGYDINTSFLGELRYQFPDFTLTARPAQSGDEDRTHPNFHISLSSK